ncbi:hypothetical protein SIPHO067v1_p0033 [Vibrio phage 51E28.1]|nr:hypothetical protein SIPHO068v1_p0067 [Vibrio phage 51E28.4]QZI92873.1 hypothetical protein SIPHO067v1_p0033 [Vibrio phage 51E28.1]
MLKTTNSLSLFCLALAKEPISGYNITKQIKSAWSHQQVYRECRRLSDAGLMTYEVKHNNGKPDSKLYTITSEGYRQIDVLVKKFERIINLGRDTPRFLLPALVQLNRSDMITVSATKDLLVLWQNKLIERAQTLKSEINSIKKSGKGFSAECMIYTEKLALNQAMYSSVAYSLRYDLV